MKILAIDTSTEVCSVAILVDGEVLAKLERAPRKHAELILPMIKSLLSEGNIVLSQLDALALSAGPGSFTGIRIATGVVQGIAYGVDLPVALISTLAVMAQGVADKYKANNVLPALDARMQQVYWGVYHLDEDDVMQSVVDDSVVDPQKVFVPEYGDWVGVSSGWQEHSEALQNRAGSRITQVIPGFYPEAKYALPIARKKYDNKELVLAESVCPAYLRENVLQKNNT